MSRPSSRSAVRAAISRPLVSGGRFFTGPMRDVRSAAFRVAAIATLIVGVAFVVIAAAVMLIVNHNLTSTIDGRLQSRLVAYVANLSGQPLPPTAGGLRGPGDRSLQEPLVTWVVYATGETQTFVDSRQFQPTGALPPSAHSVTAPTEVTLTDGSEMRVAGVGIDESRILVGQSLANVRATRYNILVAELFVGPLLLIAVFFGALTVGRRVGSPIERARQRQVALTADASHELRTPLSVIEAQTTLALERERDAEWYRRAFQAVGVESKRMRRLVDDLLWLARFDSTGTTPSSEAVDLGVLAAQAATRFEAVAESHEQTLRVRVDDVSTVISAPPEWLDRLLGVLLDNACRYTPPGGVIDVAVGRQDGRVRLAVDDSGPGISPGERDHIFDRFHRASDTPGGSGLGLAIAAAVVGSSGGRWDVGESPLGGAGMTVTWPPLIRCALAAEGSAAVDEPPAVPASAVLTPPPPPQPA